MAYCTALCCIYLDPGSQVDLLLDPLLLLLKQEHSRAEAFILKNLPMINKGLCRI